MEPTKIAIDSEIGPLECVLVHTPGREMENMTPDTAAEVLYDDILNLPLAVAEHRQLTGVLRKGARVWEFSDLVTDILKQPRERERLVHQLCALFGCPDLVRDLCDMPPRELADQIFAGTAMPRNSLERLLSPMPYALPPLPNAFFTRDATMCANDRLVIGSMAHGIRAAESLLLRSVFLHHPMFESGGFYFDGSPDHAGTLTIEGGDLLMIRRDLALVGYSERTSAAGIDVLMKSMAAAGTIKNVLVVEIPKRRATIHLDMIFTMVDRDACVVFEPLITGKERCRAFLASLAGGGIDHIAETDGILDGLRRVGLDLEPIPCGGRDRITQEREQWSSGANFFALAPGHIIGFRHNRATMEELAKAGFRIASADAIRTGAEELVPGERVAVAMDGAELSRGGGGCRCMTMPISRRPVDW